MYFLSLNRHMTLFILFFKMCIQFKQKVCSIKKHVLLSSGGHKLYFYPVVGTNYTIIQRWAQTILFAFRVRAIFSQGRAGIAYLFVFLSKAGDETYWPVCNLCDSSESEFDKFFSICINYFIKFRNIKCAFLFLKKLRSAASFFRSRKRKCTLFL